MLPTEREGFFLLVARELGAYAKQPSEADLEAWWHECRTLTMDGVEAAFRAHRDDPDRGERAPRPIDLTRRMRSGDADRSRCAARDATGQCEYPGLFSDGTGGEGPWWCPLHRIERAGPEASKRIDYSRNIAWATFREKQLAKRSAENAKAPAVIERAWDIAKRHGDRPWQSGEPFAFPLKREEAA